MVSGVKGIKGEEGVISEREKGGREVLCSGV